MDSRETVKEVIINKGGIAKSADFVAAGIRAVDVVNLCNDGLLNRVRHGYYELAEESEVSEEQLLATLVPKGIICVESALFHYGYSDFAPRKWSIAIPRSMSRTKLNVNVLALQPYYVQAELYDLGKTTDDFDGVTLPVYDRERTICDCFKYRSKLDNEIFNKALNAYTNDTKKNLNNLSSYMTNDKHKKYVIRSLRKGETELLKDFLYEAIFIPKGAEPPERDIIEKPELRVYTDDFGIRKGDNCLVADFGGKVIGAVWTRIMDDYGHVDDDTPSFAISLYKEYRGQGIGSQLMVKMLELLKWQGYERASLAVQKANYAAKMYKNVGFNTVDENAEEYIMVCEL